MIQPKDNSDTMTRLRTNSEGPNIENHIHHYVDHTDVAALAELYNAPPASRFDREELLTQARLALMKYELAEDDQEIAAQCLARSMHMLLDQSGLKKLEPQRMATLEKDVLEWCGVCQSSVKTIEQPTPSSSRDIGSNINIPRITLELPSAIAFKQLRP